MKAQIMVDRAKMRDIVQEELRQRDEMDREAAEACRRAFARTEARCGIGHSKRR